VSSNFRCQIFIYLLFSLFLVQAACAEEIDASQKINDAICIFIYLVEFCVGAIAAVVIIFMGLRYLSSADDSGARYMARIGIISAFFGILFVVLAVPVVNIIGSGLIGTVECSYFPDISGSGASPDSGPANPGGKDPASAEKSADIAAKGFILTKSVEDLLKAPSFEFPLYFQIANVGTQSSPNFMNKVSMESGMDIIELCGVPAVGLPADGKTMLYPCVVSDLAGVKRILSGSGSVKLVLKTDVDSAVMDKNRDNNKFSQDLSLVPVKQVSDDSVGDMGGISINYVRENP
jgi:hypothetical protein